METQIAATALIKLQQPSQRRPVHSDDGGVQLNYDDLVCHGSSIRAYVSAETDGRRRGKKIKRPGPRISGRPAPFQRATR